MANRDEKRGQAQRSERTRRGDPPSLETRKEELDHLLRAASGDDAEGDSCTVVHHRDEKESDS